MNCGLPRFRHHCRLLRFHARLSRSPATAPLETLVGLNWINRVAIITLVFGAAFFFKYAIDSNWIGPGVRVAMGVLAAGVAVLFGHRLWHRGQQVFAQGLLGLGLALLYLSFYAAFQLYNLFPQSVSFLLMIAVTGLAFGLSVKYDSAATALLGSLGGYLTPVVLSTGQNHPWVLFGYVFLLNLPGTALARRRHWRVLEYVGLAATVLLYAGWYGTWFDDANRMVATVFAVAFYGQFASSPLRVVWLIIQFLASLSALAIWSDSQKFLPLEFVFAVAGLIVADLRVWKEAPAWTLFSYWFPYWIWVVSHGQPRDRIATFVELSVAFILFFAWTFWWAKLRRRAVRATELLVVAANASTFYAAAYALLNPVAHEYMAAFAIVLGGIHLLLAKLLWAEATPEDQASWPGLMALAVSLAFLTLAIPIQLAGFRATIAWALEGAGIAWIAARFKNDLMRIVAWAVFFLALCRLVILDASIYPDGKHFDAMLNARFLTFVVMTVCLWARASARGWPASIEARHSDHVAGHSVLLWILGFGSCRLGGTLRTAGRSAQH